MTESLFQFDLFLVRFKVQLQVIDHTGSTTFTLFNSIVARYLGKSAPQLIQVIQKVCYVSYDVHYPALYIVRQSILIFA